MLLTEDDIGAQVALPGPIVAEMLLQGTGGHAIRRRQAHSRCAAGIRTVVRLICQET
jgi:hypothetical protein